MMLARWRWVGAAIVCFACGGEAPATVTPPPLHVTAKPPAPPERARWVFANTDRGIVGKLDLGDQGVLYVGQSGRRELGKDGKMTDAATLAQGDLVGVMRDPQGRFVFVSSSGATWVTSEPLGALDALHPAPQGKRGHAAIGKAAIVMTLDGKLVRSTDFGATWTPIDYAGANKPFGRADQVALDSKGNGVLLHLPQRLFVTHDDGVTWAPVASHGLGAHLLGRDGADRIIAWGYRGERAKLDGNALVRTTELATPMYQAQAAPPSGEPSAARTLLTGERFVEFTISGQGKGRAVSVGSARLGEKIAQRVPSGDLVGQDGLSPHIAGWGPDIVYLRADDDADATSPAATVFRSKDYGATWQKDGVLGGIDPAESDGVDVAAGPRGWTYVASLCARGETSGSGCNRRQIRPAGAKGFEDLAFVEEFEPVRFAFDEAHDKVYAIGLHDGRKYVYASPLGQNKFARTHLLDVAPYASANIGVDGKGVAHVLSFDSAHDAWSLVRGDDQTKEAPTPSFLALPRGMIELAGARGVLFASLADAYETADAGETWTRVASNGGARNLACTDAGCINGDAQRVGWDLPAIHGDVISAQAEAPHHDATEPPPSLPATELTCNVSGSGSPLTSIPSGELVDGVGADRWAGVTSKGDGTFAVVVATKNAVRTRQLLGPYPTPARGAPPSEWRMGERVLDDGVVVARYKFTPRSVTGTYNPVDVDLAWWSAQNGQTHHHLLEKVKPFRVSRYGFSGTPEIVDGGFLFQGDANDPLYFVRDDEKVERLTLPAMLLDRETERIGKRWVIADGYNGIVHLTESDDAGKTWNQTAWSLDTTGQIGLSRVGDHASVTLGTASAPSLLFDVAATLPEDPPAPIAIDPVPAGVCDAHAGRHRFSSYLPSTERSLHVRIDNVKGADKWATSFLAQTRVTHDTPAGKMCVSAYAMHGTDTHAGYDYQTVYVYPEASGAWTGWRIRRADSRVGYVAEPLVCRAPK